MNTSKDTKKNEYDLVERIFGWTVLAFIASVVGYAIYCGTQPEPPAPESRITLTLKGEHALRKFKIVSDSGEVGKVTFFIIGDNNKGNFAGRMVSFSFKLATGEYAICELPLTKIRVKCDSKYTEPYITFSWREPFWLVSKTQDMMTDCVEYMTVYCREEDFPAEVNISDI